MSHLLVENSNPGVNEEGLATMMKATPKHSKESFSLIQPSKKEYFSTSTPYELCLSTHYSRK